MLPTIDGDAAIPTASAAANCESVIVAAPSAAARSVESSSNCNAGASCGGVAELRGCTAGTGSSDRRRPGAIKQFNPSISGAVVRKLSSRPLRTP